MDGYADLPQGSRGSSPSDAFHSVGLTLVTPFRGSQLSPDELVQLWQNVSSQEYMFNDFERGNMEGFLTRTMDDRHLHLMFGQDGYCLVLNAWACDTPELHFCIWNRERSKRQVLEAARQIVTFVFAKMRAVRIGSFIPEYHKDATSLATLIGFKFEGCIRRGALFMGKHYDVNAYGLLREEWSNSHAYNKH